jgi:quercetin dioxygenase-like cupin family protein
MATFPEPPTFDLAAELADLRRSARPGGHGARARTLVKQPDLRAVLVALEPGGRLAEHHAPGSITVQALAGRLRFAAAGRVVDLAAGQLLTLGGAIAHELEATEESAFLLTIAWPGGEAAAPPVVAGDEDAAGH